VSENLALTCLLLRTIISAPRSHDGGERDGFPQWVKLGHPGIVRKRQQRGLNQRYGNWPAMSQKWQPEEHQTPLHHHQLRQHSPRIGVVRIELESDGEFCFCLCPPHEGILGHCPRTCTRYPDQMPDFMVVTSTMRLQRMPGSAPRRRRGRSGACRFAR